MSRGVRLTCAGLGYLGALASFVGALGAIPLDSALVVLGVFVGSFNLASAGYHSYRAYEERWLW
jgi:hypothetical protein